MDSLWQGVVQIGFSYVVALYLLVRVEQRMSELTTVIQKVCTVCELIERDSKQGGCANAEKK